MRSLFGALLSDMQLTQASYHSPKIQRQDTWLSGHPPDQKLESHLRICRDTFRVSTGEMCIMSIAPQHWNRLHE